MLVGRIVKETLDTSRVTVDFSSWLDNNGETLSALTNSLVIQGAFGWSSTPPPQSTPVIPFDPTPLLITSLGALTSSQVRMFLDAGTPGMAYTVQFAALGTSGRRITIEVGVQLTGTPPLPVVAIPPAITPPPFLSGSVVSGLAAAGTGQSTALLLPASVNIVSSAGGSGGFILPASLVQGVVVVQNLDAVNNASVWPPPGAQIFNLGLNMPYVVDSNGGRISFSISPASPTWYAG